MNKTYTNVCALLVLCAGMIYANDVENSQKEAVRTIAAAIVVVSEEKETQENDVVENETVLSQVTEKLQEESVTLEELLEEIENTLDTIVIE